jgi:hypothetical protein
MKKKAGNKKNLAEDAKPRETSSLPFGSTPAVDAALGKESPWKRRRLSKAFDRPLDKKVRHSGFIHDSFVFPEAEYLYLAELKKRLNSEGIEVRKSELLRAGLTLLFALDDEEMKALVSKILRPGQEAKA